MDQFELAENKYKEACDYLVEADFTQAIRLLVEAFKSDSTNDHYTFKIAESYYFLGDYQKAQEYTNITLNLYEDSYKAFCLMAIMEQERGHRFSASGYLHQAIQITRENTYQLLFLIGRTQMCLEKNDLAVKIFKLMMTINDSLVREMGLVVCAFADAGKPDEGLIHCARILKIEPEDAFSHYAAAVCYEKKCNYVQTLEWLFKAKELGLKDADKDIRRVLKLYGETQVKNK